MNGSYNHAKGNQDIEESTIVINHRPFKVYSYEEAHRHFGYVYVTINTISNKRYIGISYKNGKSTRSYLGSGTYLKSALKKYGRENFKKYIIDVAGSKYYLVHLEALYIKYYFGENCAVSSNWYNITDGLQRGGNLWKGLSEGDRAIKGEKISAGVKKWFKEHPEEVKLKAIRSSKWMKEYFKNPDNREKTSLATKQGMQNPKVKEKLRKPHYKARGVSKGLASSETRIKQSKVRAGRVSKNRGKHIPKISEVQRALNIKLYVVTYGNSSYFFWCTSINELISVCRKSITPNFPCRQRTNDMISKGNILYIKDKQGIEKKLSVIKHIKSSMEERELE